jgi:hypothetical protein
MIGVILEVEKSETVLISVPAKFPKPLPDVIDAGDPSQNEETRDLGLGLQF